MASSPDAPLNDASPVYVPNIDEPDSKRPRVSPSSLPPSTFSPSWGKTHPHTPTVPLGTPPCFVLSSPALCLHVHACCPITRARACTLHLPHGPVPLPMFMPVGTRGTVKGLSCREMSDASIGLGCPIILGNTYHLAVRPTTELLEEMGGLHSFMNWKGNLLTDSGGFQMVSLLKLADIGEEGVTFQSPLEGEGRLLLRPEDSIAHQNRIGADIIMALDDVVSSVSPDRARFEEATDRTVRWLDRCFLAHSRPKEQNLFPIVQGGLDCSPGGLRDACLSAFHERDEKIPGYAIGGLAGGESKDAFWRVVGKCCASLPDGKPRYLMGVGYPIDLVVCTALGVDMYDCVYPTRTARFGVALLDTGTLRLKSRECADDASPLDEECVCVACTKFTRERLHIMVKEGDPIGVQLLTMHNVAYMMRLVTRMRDAILEGVFIEFVKVFVRKMFPGEIGGKKEIPLWVKDALKSVDITF